MCPAKPCTLVSGHRRAIQGDNSDQQRKDDHIRMYVGMYVCMYVCMYVRNRFMGEVYEFAYAIAMSTLHGEEEQRTRVIL